MEIRPTRHEPYDSLAEEEQAAVPADWYEQIRERIADLDLVTRFIMEGRTWSEADEEGRVVIQSSEGRLISARATASWVADALSAGRVESADRVITEAISRLVLSGGAIPDEVLGEPGATGDERYDLLIATSFAYAVLKRGLDPLPWMTALPALTEEWVWDGDSDASEEFAAFVRANTPRIFLSNGILLRERDLIAP